MCANMFDVINEDERHCVILSRRAANSFTKSNMDILKAYYNLVISEVNIIEEIGGGSC